MDLFDDLEQIGDESEEDVRIELDEFHQAVIWGTDWTTGTIVNQLNKKNIDLNPKFQRREAWSAGRKSSFIESLILGLPIPQIILAEKKDKKGTYIVIDGKQRLLSIRQFFSKPDDDLFPSLKLRGLDTLNELNQKSFHDLDKDPSYEEHATAIENQTIRTIVIKNWPNEAFLYNVFLRLNTGSLPLSPQELRQALHPGQFIDFVDEFSIQSDQIKKTLKIKKPDYRMRDVELVVRYYAFKNFINSYHGNLKRFFDETVQKLNDEWDQKRTEIEKLAEELNEAIDFSFSIWGDNTFRKWKDDEYQGRFNRAIFDIMTYYFSQQEIRDACDQHKSEIEAAFKQLCDEDSEFLNSFETSTKNIQPTRKRYVTWGNKLAEITDTVIDVPNITST